MRRTIFLVLVFLCLCSLPSALGEEVSYSFQDDGVRLYLPETWRVITLSNLDSQEEFLLQMGTTAEALKSSFLASGTLMEAYTDQGSQWQLRRQALPEGISAQNVFAMPAKEKEAFLLTMARAGGFGHGTWSEDAPAFAVFSGDDAVQALSVHTIAYATVYYGQVYMITTEIIGRDVTQKDQDLIKQVSSSLLFLGAKSTPVPTSKSQLLRATLSPEITPTPAPAEVRVQRDDAVITLDDVPSTSDVSFLTIHGVTEPYSDLRYYVNTVGYERFTADAEGRFTIFVRSLPEKGKNTVMVQAKGEKGYGAVSFTVYLDQARTPLALTPAKEAVVGKEYEVSGSTLPGAKVTVIVSKKTYNAQVDQNGGFSCLVPLPKIGQNTISVESVLEGYRRGTESLIVERSPSASDEADAFLKKVKRVSYEKLLKQTAGYQDVKIQWQGTILSLSNTDGQPLMAVSDMKTQNTIIVKCSDLLSYEIGQEVQLLCTLDGSIRNMDVNGQLLSLPCAELNYDISSNLLD